jgi:DNA-binding transcriptional MocR family regulator
MAWRECDARQDGTTAELSGFAWTPDRFNPRVRAVTRAPRAGAVPSDIISLAYGMPDPILFPTAGLAAAAEEALRDPARYAVALQYSNVGGNPLLLTELGQKLEAEEGRPVEAGSLAMTNGSSQAIALVVQALAAPGDVCLCEAPTFLGTIHHIRFQGVRTVPVALDDEGLEVEALEGKIQQLESAGTPPRFLYTIPTFNNPAGVTMSLARRRALLDIVARHGVPVIEDDAYRDLRFEGEPVPTLHALDRDGLVVRLGTFSKIVAPGVRLGFVLADPAVIERVLAFKAEGSTNGFASMVVGTFMKTGGLAAHIQTLRTAYRARRDAMYEALAREMPAGVTWTRTEGGFFLWLTLPSKTDMTKVHARAAEERVVALAGTECFPDGRGTHNLRLSFSLQPADLIAEGIRRLAVAVRAGL